MLRRGLALLTVLGVGAGALEGRGAEQSPDARVGRGVEQSPDARVGRGVEQSPDALGASLPRLVGLLNLALIEPQLAASLVPDPWVDAFVEGALRVAVEEAGTRLAMDPPQAFPVGPWRSETELVATIEAVDPRAAGALYGALGGRLDPRCRAVGLSLEACDARIRGALARLASPAVVARSRGNVAIPVTRTQRELVRLGGEVARVSASKLAAIERVVWPAR